MYILIVDFILEDLHFMSFRLTRNPKFFKSKLVILILLLFFKPIESVLRKHSTRNFSLLLSLNWQIQSKICDVHLLYIPSSKHRFPVDWRLLVEECIANIG